MRIGWLPPACGSLSESTPPSDLQWKVLDELMAAGRKIYAELEEEIRRLRTEATTSAANARKRADAAEKDVTFNSPVL